MGQAIYQALSTFSHFILNKNSVRKTLSSHFIGEKTKPARAEISHLSTYSSTLDLCDLKLVLFLHQPLLWRSVDDKWQVILTKLLVSHLRSPGVWSFLKLGWWLPSLPPASFKYRLSYPSSLLTNVSSALHRPSDQRYFSYCPLNFLWESGLLLILDPVSYELVNGRPYLTISSDSSQQEPPCISHPLGTGLSMACCPFHVNLSKFPGSSGRGRQTLGFGPRETWVWISAARYFWVLVYLFLKCK